ncbi:unnamed protein product [Chilo suppressalis]|uniref:Uncharacterized protein n=1 Tax=Chilo suppressalis TaxID=168631 RepID=A0ABN8B967_CHISP|nr:unnamed protein product [Chilo suppressalis]
MRLDVLPERVDDDGSGLRVHAQQPGQPLVQLVLHGLVVQQQQDRAAHVLVARPLHLEPVGLLRGEGAVPLHQVVVGPVQLLVQLDHQRLEERRELALHLIGIILGVVEQSSFHAQLPRCHGVISLSWVEGVGDEYAQLPLLLHGPLERLLYVEPLAHDGGVQLALEREQVHVGLRLRHQVAHLLWQYFVRQSFLAFTTSRSAAIHL